MALTVVAVVSSNAAHADAITALPIFPGHKVPHVSRTNLVQRLPWVLLAMASALLVALAGRHRALRETFVEHRRSDMRIQEGEYVPAFTGLSVSGDTVTVGDLPTPTRQIVVFLTSTCPFCHETMPKWKEIATRLAALPPPQHRVEMVALTTDSAYTAKTYAESNQLPFPLVPFQSRRIASLYRARVVPQTIVIDNTGRVLFARHGVIKTVQAVDSVIAVAVQTDPARRSLTRTLSADSGARLSVSPWL